MSGALDRMTDEETALLRQMRDDDAGEPAPSAPEPAPPAAAESEHDPEPQTTEQPDQPQKRDKTVPYGALAEERAKRKALEERLAKAEDERIRAARLEERYDLLLKAAQASQPPAPAPVEEPVPDFNTDPAANIEARFTRMQKELAESREALQQINAQRTQETQLSQLRAWGAAQENEFAARQADYAAAANHLRAAREAQLQELGITNKAERDRYIANDITQIAMRAAQDGSNFAEKIYNLSKSFGYQPPAAAPAAPPAAATTSIPSIEDVLAAPATQEERRAQLTRGKEMATTLSGPGAAPPGKLTPERIATMSEREFDALYAKMSNNPAAMRELFGE